MLGHHCACTVQVKYIICNNMCSIEMCIECGLVDTAETDRLADRRSYTHTHVRARTFVPLNVFYSLHIFTWQRQPLVFCSPSTSPSWWSKRNILVRHRNDRKWFYFVFFVCVHYLLSDYPKYLFCLAPFSVAHWGWFPFESVSREKTFSQSVYRRIYLTVSENVHIYIE